MSCGPNIIIFLVDDQAWSGTSIRRYHPYRPDSRSEYFEMPRLEELAQRGIRFTDAYAPATLCAPSRISIQLGQSPARLHATTFCGIQQDGQILQKRDSRRESLAEMVKRGRPEYRTAHFGKWHIYGHTPTELGYDESDGPTDNPDGEHSIEGDVHVDPKRIFEITDRAVDFMDRSVAAGMPFLLQVSHYALHLPVECLAESLDHFTGKQRGWKDIHPSYAAMSRDLDEGLGRLVDALVRLEIDTSTYVFYLSDNGGNACDDISLTNLNKPLRRGKQFLHEGGIRIPFVVSGPSIPRNSTSSEPVIAYDLMPTIGDLLGIDVMPDDLEGVSLRPLLEAPHPMLHESTCREPLEPILKRSNDAFIWHVPYRVPYFTTCRESAIRAGRYKLIKNWDGDFVELFDLKVDLEERVDLATRKPTVAAELERRLVSYLHAVNAEMNVPFTPELWRQWQSDDQSLRV